MSLALQDASATLFLRGLNVLSGLVDKAVQSGLDAAAIMDARLAPDMKPFPDQVRMAAFSARSCVARLTGQDWPKTDDSEATLAELKATIALSIAVIEATDAAAFEGGETRRIEIRFPGVELDFEGAGYLTSFALPNFYFHVSMAYAILRNAGVELGKRDYLGTLALV
ncbi:DUF1993 domain-containing protein [Brevundimonas sp. Root608]|uniref:DUF1993 domain-containing protein n=1 Tax=Brevundimonas sp. Root608 TaxID=1736569 RepID=UPI0006F48C85|nr:DUF1993 domain-containing protein [Brevundimonas sp. Root608]KRA21966.1 hypothetical protein ASD59_10405 [Brevundimonas sp. Root608]